MGLNRRDGAEMLLEDVCPVMLCGGSEKKLWPVSRANAPQQFARIGDRPSLFQNTLRLLADVGLGRPAVVTPFQHRHLVQDQMDEIGITSRALVAEPEDRGSTASICAAAEVVAQSDPDALLLLMLSDDCGFDPATLDEALRLAIPEARDGNFVTFGIAPEWGQTGHTVIEMAQGTSSSATPQPVAMILDAADPMAGASLAGSDRYLWAADLVLVSAKVLRGLYGRQAAPTRATVRRAVRESRMENQITILGESYSANEPLSFVSSILHQQQGSVVPVAAELTKVTDWRDLWEASERDNRGVASVGAALAVGCNDSLLYSTSPGVQVLGVGLRNIAVVATPDAVMVMDIDATPALPQAVEMMERKNIPQARDSGIQFHPWGQIETLHTGASHKLRWVTVKPGCCIPARLHLNRSENWVVVEGTGRVYMNGKTDLICETDKVFVQKGREYRIENPGKAPLRLVEIQSGPYLGDDDLEGNSGSHILQDSSGTPGE